MSFPAYTSSTATPVTVPVVPLHMLWVGVILTGCSSESTLVPDPEPVPEPVAIPAWGTPTTFEVATWNLLFFGAANSGPVNDSLQLARVRDVILGTDADLWGVQEVSRGAAFAQLVSQLPGYGGLLVNDPAVPNGADHYDSFELKVGLIFKRSTIEIVGARVILTELEPAFAGRPPLEVKARLTLGGAVRDVVIIVLHAKANAQVSSWERRAAAALGLKEYLDTAWAGDPVFVPGDWNDDVDESITPGRDTPYRTFVDAADWAFPTAELSAAGAVSILGFPDVIDHILASDETMAWYSPGSASVYRVDEYIPRYEETTSDHLPVLVRFSPDR